MHGSSLTGWVMEGMRELEPAGASAVAAPPPPAAADGGRQLVVS